MRVDVLGLEFSPEFADEWQKLLYASSADPLFNSPEWLETWWRQYGAVIGSSPEIIAVRLGAATVGLGFFHRRRAVHKLGLAGNRMELLGTAWRVRGVGFSERTSVLVCQEREAAVAAALIGQLVTDERWDDLVVSNTPSAGITERVFRGIHAQTGGYLRTTDRMEAWVLPLSGDFAELTARLGAGTRARMVGSRKRLAAAGTLVERILGPNELADGWRIFAQLYDERWGGTWSDHLRSFYDSLSRPQIARGVPAVSVLEFNDEPISILINLRAGGREYQLASAFKTVEVKRVSPGWLHLGLAIERACNDGMSHFDMLGGTGKQEQYKAALHGQRTTLVTLQLIRNPYLAALYRSWDGLNALRGKMGPAEAP